jgi:hypothetical protein
MTSVAFVRWRALTVALLAVLAGSVVGAHAQGVAAEVQTWSGVSLRLSEPTVEVAYTVLPPTSDRPGADMSGAPGGPSSLGAALGMLGGSLEPQVTGSVSGLAKMFKTGPEALRARREKDSLTVFRGDVEIRIPLGRLATLLVSRQRVARSPLPPYVAAQHVRHAVMAVLTDGSTVEADYVSFGTAVLSGTTPQGRVEIPLDEVERVRFSR